MTRAPLERILMVEDDPDIQAVARLSLERIGRFTLRICASGLDALAVAPGFMPQLILLDVQLPEIDGPATLARLRQIPVLQDTPVIFLTAKSQVDEVQSYRKLGAAEVIPKPFDPRELPGRLHRIWEQLG
jgi:two-component system, OmpR family, response regulator